MENKKFVLSFLHIWEEGTLQFLSVVTQPGGARIWLFKRKQSINPSYVGKNLNA